VEKKEVKTTEDAQLQGEKIKPGWMSEDRQGIHTKASHIVDICIDHQLKRRVGRQREWKALKREEIDKRPRT